MALPRDSGRRAAPRSPARPSSTPPCRRAPRAAGGSPRGQRGYRGQGMRRGRPPLLLSRRAAPARAEVGPLSSRPAPRAPRSPEEPQGCCRPTRGGAPAPLRRRPPGPRPAAPLLTLVDSGDAGLHPAPRRPTRGQLQPLFCVPASAPHTETAAGPGKLRARIQAAAREPAWRIARPPRRLREMGRPPPRSRLAPSSRAPRSRLAPRARLASARPPRPAVRPSSRPEARASLSTQRVLLALRLYGGRGRPPRAALRAASELWCAPGPHKMAPKAGGMVMGTNLPGTGTLSRAACWGCLQ